MEIYLGSATFMEDMLRTNKEDLTRKNSNADQPYAKARIFLEPEIILSNKTISDTYKLTTERFCFKPESAPKLSEVIKAIQSLHPYMEKFDEYRAHLVEIAKINSDIQKSNSIKTKNIPEHKS